MFMSSTQLKIRDINNLNRHMERKAIKETTKSLPRNKKPAVDRFTVEFYKLKEHLTLITLLLKLFILVWVLLL